MSENIKVTFESGGPYIRTADEFKKMATEARQTINTQLHNVLTGGLAEMDRQAATCAGKGLSSCPFNAVLYTNGLRDTRHVDDYINMLLTALEERGLGLYAHVNEPWERYPAADLRLPKTTHLVWGDHVEGYQALSPGFEKVTMELIRKVQKS